MKKIQNDLQKLGIAKIIFLGGLLLTEIAMLVAAYITRGEEFQNLLYADKKDTFMDFYNVMILGKNPYTQGHIYPPLIHVILSALGHFIPYEFRDQGAFAVRGSQLGMMVLLIWMFVQIYLFAVLFRMLYKSCARDKECVWERELLLVLLLLSLPFLWCFERGNSIFLALVCLIPYILWYHSENKWLRLLAYIGLAASASIKIYPAIFGLLLVREKRWKQTFRLLAAGILVFLFPFLLLERENRNPLSLIQNLLHATTVFSQTGTGYRHDLSTTFRVLGELSGNDFTFAGKIITLLLGVVGLWLFFTRRKMSKWKVYGILALLMILVTGLNYTYSLIFMVVPLVFFLQDENEKSKGMQAIYAVLFLMIFMPVVLPNNQDILGNFTDPTKPLIWSTVIANVGLQLMLLFIYGQELREIFLERKQRCTRKALQ